ncbi:MAG: DUF488 family protein [Betaproteobacteria bacterium]|nr:DUF488 family protein [Betaproteobacteria bacterium]
MKPPAAPPSTPSTPSSTPSKPPSTLPRLVVRRVYDPPSPDDGYRVLVDRLWPRGLRREAAAVDLWFQDIAPSPALRSWFGHEPERFRVFAERYRAELDQRPDEVRRMAQLLRANGRLSLLYAARDPVHNHAVVLAAYLEAPAAQEDAAEPVARPAGLLERLRDEHAQMLDGITELRVALLRGDVQGARTLLSRLAELHAEHARSEESALLPALPRAARWPRRTYEAEHAALAQALGALRDSLRELPARLRSPRQRLQLVDSALPLRHLLEHHFEREEKGLFEEVDLNPDEPVRPASR